MTGQSCRLLLEQIAGLTARIDALTKTIDAMSREAETSRWLQAMRGVGPIGGLAIETFAPPVDHFRRGRDFASWLGLVSRQNSSGCKQRFRKTSRMGLCDVRRLLITGAMAAVRWALRRGDPRNRWLARMLERKPPMAVAFALANTMARGIWATLTRGENYRDPPIASAA